MNPYRFWLVHSEQLWSGRLKEKEKTMIIRVVCEYCGQTNDGSTQLQCRGCGAGLPPITKEEFAFIPTYKTCATTFASDYSVRNVVEFNTYRE